MKYTNFDIKIKQKDWEILHQDIRDMISQEYNNYCGDYGEWIDNTKKK